MPKITPLKKSAIRPQSGRRSNRQVGYIHGESKRWLWRPLKRAAYGLRLAAVYAVTGLAVVYSLNPLRFARAAPVVPLVARDSYTRPPDVISGTPVRVTVQAVNINLAVEPGPYDPASKTWALSPGNAHYALPSMPPNNYRGTTLIYAHNSDLVFGLLRNLSPGQAAELTADDGRRFIYSYSHVQTVTPDNTSLFRFDGPPTLVLQTCSGNWNEARRLYYFEFKEVR